MNNSTNETQFNDNNNNNQINNNNNELNNNNDQESQFDIEMFIYFINAFRIPGQETTEAIEPTYIDPVLFSLAVPGSHFFDNNVRTTTIQGYIDELDRRTVEEEIDCEICFKLKSIKTTLDCSHSFCKDCMVQWVNKLKNSCPMCRTPISHT
jgi:hypothetical protein